MKLPMKSARKGNQAVWLVVSWVYLAVWVGGLVFVIVSFDQLAAITKIILVVALVTLAPGIDGLRQLFGSRQKREGNG